MMACLAMKSHHLLFTETFSLSSELPHFVYIILLFCLYVHYVCMTIVVHLIYNSIVALQDEMNNWIGRINAAIGGDAATSPARAQTLPAQGAREEPKRRSFFTLGKKK